MLSKKPLIILGIAGGGLLLLFVGLFAFLSFKIRDIKTPLLEALQSQIDGQLKIGSADVVFFPAGINLKDVQLFAPGETEPSASIKRAELRFDLLPLIQKKIETRVTVIEPEIRFKRGKDGHSNMEKIFAPMVSGESKGRISQVDQLWWKRLAVGRLRIEKAHFIASREGSPEVTELKNLSVEADQIRFESDRVPAKIRIRYDMPQVSKEPMELETRMRFVDGGGAGPSLQNTGGQAPALRAPSPPGGEGQAMPGPLLRLEEGQATWGPAQMKFGGEAGLPNGQRQDVALNLNFASETIDLKKLNKILLGPLPASGDLTFKGSVTGTAFAPMLSLVLDSPALNVSGKSISNVHAELFKKDKPLEIKNGSFGIYGGSVGISGQALLGPTTSANLNLALKSLSLAAMSGSKSPARLSGNLQMSSPNVKNPGSFSGGGKISVGPFPLPVVNLQNKVKVAEILAAGTTLGQMVNLGMLASSANVIGTQIDQINATVHIAGGNVSLAPFSLGNGHFNATGSGTIAQQKSIHASGTVTINRGVTAQLIPGAALRQIMTNGTGALSVPFSLNGPLGDPDVTVDSGYLKNLAAKATAIGLTNLLAGGIRPENILNSALKNTPLGDPKNPLSQILGTAAPSQTQTASNTSTSTKKRSTTTTTTSTQKSRSATGNKLVDQLLFGR